MNISADNVKAVAIGAGVLVVGVLAYKAYGAVTAGAKAATEMAGQAANAVNPLNNDNIFATTVNAAGGAVAGSDDWSLGGWIYDMTHDAPDFNAPVTPTKNTGGATGWW